MTVPDGLKAKRSAVLSSEGIMYASPGNIWDAFKFLSFLWLILSAEPLLVSGQEGKLSWLTLREPKFSFSLFYFIVNVNCCSHLITKCWEFLKQAIKHG